MQLPCYIKTWNGKEPDASFEFAESYDGFDAAWDAVDMALRGRPDLPDGAFKVTSWGTEYWLSDDGSEHHLFCWFAANVAVRIRYGDDAEIVTRMRDEIGDLGDIHVPDAETGQRKVVANLLEILPSFYADDVSGKFKDDFYDWLDVQVRKRAKAENIVGQS